VLCILAVTALVLLVVLPALMQAQAQQPARRRAALSSLNAYLDNVIYPAEMSQAKGLNRQQFSAWLNQAPLQLGVKRDLRKQLQPVLATSRFAAVLLKVVKIKTGGKADYVLIGIVPALRAQFDASA
jgi:ABC-type protease/lipase transport system fused ATPase/permease subunit